MLPTKANDVKVLRLSNTNVAREIFAQWGSTRFDKALLCLGDTTVPLAAHASHWVAVSPSGTVGLGVKFSGFSERVVSIATDEQAAFDALLGCCVGGDTATLVVSCSSPTPPEPWSLISTDYWMTGFYDEAPARPNWIARLQTH